MRLMAMTLTSNVQRIEAIRPTAVPKSMSQMPNSTSPVAAPASAFGNRTAASMAMGDASGANRFHASDTSTLAHIASFMSIGCSAFTR